MTHMLPHTQFTSRDRVPGLEGCYLICSTFLIGNVIAGTRNLVFTDRFFHTGMLCWDRDRGMMGIRPNHCQFRGAPRMTLPHLHHHHHHLDPLYNRTTQFHLHHHHHHLDPLYSRTIEFHLHHHHWFNQPRRLELLFCMVRLRPYHILL